VDHTAGSNTRTTFYFNSSAIEIARNGVIMAKVILGNHAAVFVPLQDRDRVRKFYRDVLGGKITSEEDQKDLFRIGDNFYLGFSMGITLTRASF
jgi:hypothetical protein